MTRVDTFTFIGSKIIGRIPTPANYKENGSDNSLYICSKNNTSSLNDLMKIIDCDDISNFKKQFNMNSSAGYIEVNTNINADGQVQINIGSDGERNGIMAKIYEEDNKRRDVKLDRDSSIMLLDFANNEIFLAINPDQQKNNFKNYGLNNKKKLKDNTVNQYIKDLESLPKKYPKDFDFDIFLINDVDRLNKMIKGVEENPDFKSKNNTGHRELQSAVSLYKKFLSSKKTDIRVMKYSSRDFNKEVFVGENVGLYNDLTNLIKYKQNIILQGAPGVGKTFIAKRLAYSLIGYKKEENIELVQFHQNYSYEDFVMGYKPISNGFELKKGIFYKLCKKALSNPQEKYVMIIDEINRGNLDKIFGELFMLLEKDKRNEEYAVKLAYSEEDDRFYIPNNLYIIGTMNTADKSLTMLDFALRRRFGFYYISPVFEDASFKSMLTSHVGTKISKYIIDTYIKLNKKIANSEELGKGFCIGQSYFCSFPSHGKMKEKESKNWYNMIVEYEIKPLLYAYCWDCEYKADNLYKEIKMK